MDQERRERHLECEKAQYLVMVLFNGLLAAFWSDHLGAASKGGGMVTTADSSGSTNALPPPTSQFLVRTLHYVDWSHLSTVFLKLLGERRDEHMTSVQELIYLHTIMTRVVEEVSGESGGVGG